MGPRHVLKKQFGQEADDPMGKLSDGVFRFGSHNLDLNRI